MQINFQEALKVLNETKVFEIANQARTPADYFLASILPERGMPTYDVEKGYMTVRSMLAQVVGMDSPFPGSAYTEISHLKESTLKIANEVAFGEKQMRDLRQFMFARGLGMGSESSETVVKTLLNFFNKVILQSQFDTMEWMRAQALTTGKLDFINGDLHIEVDYGFPNASLPSTRTGNDAYHGSASKFWDDMRTTDKTLGYKTEIRIASSATIASILDNSVNNILVTEQDMTTGIVEVTRHVGSVERPSTDKRDRVRLVAYNKEYEVMDPATKKPVKKQYIPDGTILCVGGERSDTFRIGEGGTNDPETNASIGYTHIAPTEEGKGSIGRWGRLYTPADAPAKLIGQAVTNGLPVIENAKRVVALTTEMP